MEPGLGDLPVANAIQRHAGERDPRSGRRDTEIFAGVIYLDQKAGGHPLVVRGQCERPVMHVAERAPEGGEELLVFLAAGRVVPARKTVGHDVVGHRDVDHIECAGMSPVQECFDQIAIALARAVMLSPLI